MKKHSVPLGAAIFLLIVGLFLGTVFTFGMQHWNAEVPREACMQIETQILDHKVKPVGRTGASELIYIECANGERNDIDSVSSTAELQRALTALPEDEKVTLLVRPNSSAMVVGIYTESETLLDFDEAIEKLGGEAAGFLFLGLFLYLVALIGLYHIICRAK